MIQVAGTVRDVDVFELDIEHTYIQDLDVALIHPDGTSALLWDRACSSENNIFASFDDEATADAPCPPIDGGFYLSADDPLSVFDDLEMAGQWTLRVTDNADQDGGILNGFTLKICFEDPLTLPVELLSFEAIPQKDHILLDWVTRVETNNRGFMVERSLTGAADWMELDFVAAGEDYTFPDRTALANTDYYYRLRQEDLNGRVSYSSIEIARYGNQSGLVLFPNPTGNTLNYRIPGQATQLPYNLIDVNGRVVLEGLLQPEGGHLELINIPSGVYFLRFSGETRKVTKL